MKGWQKLVAKNYKHEIKDAVHQNFREGIDKHSRKADGGMDGKITGYTTKKDTVDVAKNFGSWMAEHHPEVKSPLATKKEMITEFLEEKAKECTQYTIDTYRDRIKAIGKCVAAKYHTKVDWSVPEVIAVRAEAPDRGAKHTMPKEYRDKLLAWADKSDAGSAFAVKMEAFLGARVSDVAYGMKDLGDRMLLPNCKGGKKLYRPITPEFRAILDDPRYAQYKRGQGFALPKDDSINTWIRRAFKAMGLERYSFHDFRRLCAQEHYDELRHGGATRSEALKSTSEWLNHGRKRNTMNTKSYIANPW